MEVSGIYYSQRAPTDISPAGTNTVAGLALVILIMNARLTSAKIKGALRGKIYYSQVLEGTWHARGPHSKVTGREREKGSRTTALPLLGPKGGVPRVLRFHSLLATLKHKSRAN